MYGSACEEWDTSTRQKSTSLISILEGNHSDVNFKAGQDAYAALRRQGLWSQRQWTRQIEQGTWLGRIRTFLAHLGWVEVAAFSWQHFQGARLRWHRDPRGIHLHRELHVLRESWRAHSFREFLESSRRDANGLALQGARRLGPEESETKLKIVPKRASSREAVWQAGLDARRLTAQARVLGVDFMQEDVGEEPTTAMQRWEFGRKLIARLAAAGLSPKLKEVRMRCVRAGDDRGRRPSCRWIGETAVSSDAPNP